VQRCQGTKANTEPEKKEPLGLLADEDAGRRRLVAMEQMLSARREPEMGTAGWTGGRAVASGKGWER
jgi:hypothetical protein